MLQTGCRTRDACLVALMFMLGACAGVPADRGFSELTATLADRGVEVAAPAAASDALLASLRDGPLDLVTAQRIALAHNPTLTARGRARRIAP